MSCPPCIFNILINNSPCNVFIWGKSKYTMLQTGESTTMDTGQITSAFKIFSKIGEKVHKSFRCGAEHL